ncbi:MAG: succinate dehydrogenase, hydrophobic membrane anchor protein [Alphaproteobacteria bacterium]
MSIISKNYKTDLKRVRGLGSAKDGTNSWWTQRLLSLALVPLSIWFASLCIRLAIYRGEDLHKLLKSPFNVIVMMVFIATGIYHGMLGIKEVIEDYVHKEGMKFFLIIIVKLVSYATIIASLSALFVYHFAVFR